MPVNLDPPIPVSGPTCPYIGSYAKFLRRFGEANVRIAANKDNSTAAAWLDVMSAEIIAAVQDSFDFTYEEINTQFDGGVYLIPFNWAPNSGVLSVVVEDWAMTIAYAHLFYGRFDSPVDYVDGEFKANKTVRTISRMLNQVYTAIALAKDGNFKRLKAARNTKAKNTPKTFSDQDLAATTAYRQAVQFSMSGGCYVPCDSSRFCR